MIWTLLILTVFRPKETEGSTLSDQFIALSSLKFQQVESPYEGIYLKQPTHPSGGSAVDYVEYLRSLAGDDFELLNKIVFCESGWNPKAANKTSSAKGLAQFLSSTWSSWGDGDIFDPFDNLKAMVRLYSARGVRPWLESKSCWQ